MENIKTCYDEISKDHSEEYLRGWNGGQDTGYDAGYKNGALKAYRNIRNTAIIVSIVAVSIFLAQYSLRREHRENVKKTEQFQNASAKINPALVPQNQR